MYFSRDHVIFESFKLVIVEKRTFYDLTSFPVTFVQNDKSIHLQYTHPNYGFFEAFLHVEEEFIPKKKTRPLKRHDTKKFWGINYSSTCKKASKTHNLDGYMAGGILLSF